MNRVVALAAAALLFSAASSAAEIVSYSAKTNLKGYEQLTLFLMSPPGGKAKGVFCLSLLASSADDVLAQLQGKTDRRSLNLALDFARMHDFAVVAWGSHCLWDSTRNWDELPRAKAKKIDADFDHVAKAWDKGIDFFVKEYGIFTAHGIGQFFFKLYNFFLISCKNQFGIRKPEITNVRWDSRKRHVSNTYVIQIYVRILVSLKVYIFR